MRKSLWSPRPEAVAWPLKPTEATSSQTGSSVRTPDVAFGGHSEACGEQWNGLLAHRDLEEASGPPRAFLHHPPGALQQPWEHVTGWESLLQSTALLSSSFVLSQSRE